MRNVALAAALAGGVSLVANLFVDTDALAWAGLALLGVAAAVVGARLVQAWWLALVCAAGSVALGWAVVEVLREAGHVREVDAVVGGLATLCVALAVVRRPAAAAAHPHRGNHRS